MLYPAGSVHWHRCVSFTTVVSQASFTLGVFGLSVPVHCSVLQMVWNWVVRTPMRCQLGLVQRSSSKSGEPSAVSSTLTQALALPLDFVSRSDCCSWCFAVKETFVAALPGFTSRFWGF